MATIQLYRKYVCDKQYWAYTIDAIVYNAFICVCCVLLSISFYALLCNHQNIHHMK